MDPRLKIVVTVALIALISLTAVGAFGSYLGFFALMMIGAVVARLDPWVVVKRSLVALPFALAAVTLIFTVPGRALGTVPMFGWTITEAGVVRFASIMFKSMVSVQAAVLLILTTHLADVLWALSALRLPQVLIAVVSFMYRYIFLLADEAVRLTRARDSRSAVVGSNPSLGRSVVFRARTVGRMIGNLFLRSFERSERVYQAMVSRGYQGTMRQLSPPPLRAQEVIVAAVTVLVGVFLTTFSILA
jgi:cobalt/nickel transport system permease protein